MRFGYVLLGLVTLTSIHTSNGQQCSNGFPGVDRDDICCAASCGVCGGGGCGSLSGGPNNCCTSRIRDSGVMCSATQPAPCIMASTAMCSNGIPGVQLGNVCCDAMCGTCGGLGCARRPGGPNYCCFGRITDNMVTCDTTRAAPCIITDPTVAPTTVAPVTVAPTTVAPVTVAPTTVAPVTVAPTTVAPVTVAPTTVAPVTVAPTTVAPTTVAPVTVAPTTVAPVTVAPTTVAPVTVAPTTVAPVTVAPTTVAPTTAAPTTVCANGLPGVQSGTICCEAGCGGCGGSGCAGLPGGMDACCTGPIGASGMMCSVTMMAPCIVDN